MQVSLAPLGRKRRKRRGSVQRIDVRAHELQQLEPEPSKRIRTLGETGPEEETAVDDARRHPNSGGYWPVLPRKR